MVTLSEDIEPYYYKYLIYLDSFSRKCMHAKAKKAKYDTLKSSLLFWTKPSKSLENGVMKNL